MQAHLTPIFSITLLRPYAFDDHPALHHAYPETVERMGAALGARSS